jgi:hypothetical protein
MKIVSALVGLAALGGVAMSSAPASAMPVAVPAQSSSIVPAAYVCNEWGHCWHQHYYGYGYYHPHYSGGWGWHRHRGYGWRPHYRHHYYHAWHPHYWGGWHRPWGYGGWHRWHHWHHWHQW